MSGTLLAGSYVGCVLRLHGAMYLSVLNSFSKDCDNNKRFLYKKKKLAGQPFSVLNVVATTFLNLFTGTK